MRRSMVVLPEPLGPRSAKNSPRSIARSMRSTAVTVPKRFVTDCSLSIAPGTLDALVGGKGATATPGRSARRRRLR
jgi:hypothetical protein